MQQAALRDAHTLCPAPLPLLILPLHPPRHAGQRQEQLHFILELVFFIPYMSLCGFFHLYKTEYLLVDINTQGRGCICLLQMYAFQCFSFIHTKRIYALRLQNQHPPPSSNPPPEAQLKASALSFHLNSKSALFLLTSCSLISPGRDVTQQQPNGGPVGARMLTNPVSLLPRAYAQSIFTSTNLPWWRRSQH